MRKEEALTENMKQDNPVVSLLQILLADLHIHYMNLRGYHWNIVGNNFFTLHAKFEEMYLDTAEKGDQVAERILALGYPPCNRYSQYLQNAGVKEIHAESDDEIIIDNLLQTYGYIIDSERKLQALASSTGDEVTADLMVNYLKEEEKTVWMLSAYLS